MVTGLLSVAPANAAALVAGAVTQSLSSTTTSVAVGTAATTTYTIAGTAGDDVTGSVVITETFPAGAGDPHGIHIHSLRHTYAYILKSQGIHVTTAQKLMGHSDPKITMAIYTRVLDNEIDSAGAVLRRLMI